MLTNGSAFADGTAIVRDMGLYSKRPAFIGYDNELADVIANEVSGTGYSDGGLTLANPAIVTTPTYTAFDTDDAVWASSSIVALWGVIYRSGTVNGYTDPILAYVLLDDTMTSVSSTNSNFSIVWNAGGILTLWSA